MIGSSIAYYLALAGHAADVVVIEPDPTYEFAATPRATGGIRQLFTVPENIRMAQYGTQHGHAGGKAQAMRTNPEVELTGVFEPDPAVRARAEQQRAFAGLRFYDSADQMLGDSGIVAVAVEGLNANSLPMARDSLLAGKHIWYDKPAGDDWEAFQEVVGAARRQNLRIQMGYMFRYSPGFATLSEHARSGQLGDIFALRAHMSTSIPLAERTEQSRHRGGHPVRPGWAHA